MCIRRRLSTIFLQVLPCSTITFDVCITNGAPTGSPRTSFIFEAIPPIETKGSDASSESVSGHSFAISGRTRVNVRGDAYNGGLATGESITIKLHAHFFQPGYYNLNCSYVDIGRKKEDDPVHLPYTKPWYSCP